MDTIEYKNVRTRVRPHRAAILVNIKEKNWKTYVENMIASFSMVWGGEYFLIIPTDGEVIHPKFWEILEAYSPDIIGRYIPTVKDLELADPKHYIAIKDRWLRQWKGNAPEDWDMEEKWAEAARGSHLKSTVEVSKDLKEELKNRLSPFCHADYVVSENIFGGQFPGYPFTNILDINKNAKNPITRVTVPRRLHNQDLNLLAISRTGTLDASLIEEYKEKNIDVLEIPEVQDNHYIELVEGKENTNGYIRTFLMYLGKKNRIPDDFNQTFPFRNSMLHLNRYYRSDIHQRHKENFRVIVGDSIEDFCLFYNLSRIHDGIFWVPDGLLHDTFTQSRRAMNGSGEQFNETQQCITQLVQTLNSLVSYGHKDQDFELMSISLSKKRMFHRKKWMSELCYFGQDAFEERVLPVDLEELKINCVFRVIEENNFHQQQDIIFQNGKSVGRVQTPQPKHFSPIDQDTHRWVAQLEIENYQLPVLPYLVDQTFEGKGVTSYDYRLSVDGLAYFCPNSILFGGDVDTNLVRPKLKILSNEEFFQSFFSENGYKTQLSDKGSYLKDTIEKFGGLEPVANFFKQAVNRKIFDLYLFDKRRVKDTNSEDIVFLDVDNRSYLSFDAFKKFLKTDELTISTLDRLVSAKVLFRGYIFQCENCRRTDWYGVEEIGRTFVCKRCEKKQEYTFQKWKWSPEPVWYYRLAETVYQFYRSHSHVTALALDKIRAGSSETFMYLSESDLIDADGGKKEIDIIALSDGEIILGECKDTNATRKELGKYLHMYKGFKYKPSKFLLATTATEVSTDIERLLQQIGNSSVYYKNDLL